MTDGQYDANPPASGAPRWHSLEIEDALQSAGSTANGLASSEAAARRLRCGPNILPSPEGRSVFHIAVGQLKSPLVFLLLGAGAVSLLLGEHHDFTLFIFLVLAINSSIGAAQEWRAEAKTTALRSMLHTNSRVLRDGVLQTIDSTDLVPGDVVALTAGDRVPADLRLLGAVDLRVDESTLTADPCPSKSLATGWCHPRPASPSAPTCSSAGSSIQSGRAEAFVVDTRNRDRDRKDCRDPEPTGAASTAHPPARSVHLASRHCVGGDRRMHRHHRAGSGSAAP